MGENVMSWLSSKIKGYDIFGKTVIPNYKTKLGGVTSMIILTFMLYTTVIFIKSVMNYSDIKFNKNEKRITLTKDLENHTFASGYGVKFAIAWTTYDNQKRIDESYGEITVVQHQYNECSGPSCQARIETTEVPLEPCHISEFSQGITNRQSSNVRFF